MPARSIKKSSSAREEAVMDENAPLEVRASWIGQVLLAGPFIAIGAFGLCGLCRSSDHGQQVAAALTFLVGMALAAWIRGPRICVRDGVFEYRDGFYRTHRRQLADIIECKSKWVHPKFLGLQFKRLPYTVVKTRGAKPVMMTDTYLKHTERVDFYRRMKRIVAANQ